ncbi:hypothetical protein LEMLEM_LOCUS15887, partial [Lemmus lemmus]
RKYSQGADFISPTTQFSVDINCELHLTCPQREVSSVPQGNGWRHGVARMLTPDYEKQCCFCLIPEDPCLRIPERQHKKLTA